MNKQTSIGKIDFSQATAGGKLTGFALVTAIEERPTKNNDMYCTLTMCDGNTSIDANFWNCRKNQLKIEEKSIILCEVLAKMYKDKMTYELISYETVDNCPFPYTDFIESAPYRGEDMYNEIINHLQSHSTGPGSLAWLAVMIYNDHKDKLLYWSAARSVHHNCYGGLLYHVFRMMRMAIMTTKVYPNIDVELLLCAVALHDIGKLMELNTDDFGIADYTVDGTLFGHLYMGAEMINAYATPEYSPERIRLLKHCIVSHHGELDWGAISKPAVKEAMLLHMLDNLDAKTYQYEAVLKTLEPGTLSDKIFSLDTKVYKPLD